MKYPWIDEYLMKKRGVTKDLQADWNWIRYHIGGKMFAAILLDDKNAPYYINLKLEPLEGESMRRKYPDIIPGYYSNKQRWNSVKADGEIPDELLKKWLDRSYHLVLRGFGKSKRREILGLSVCGMDCSACAFHGDRCRGCNEVRGRFSALPREKRARSIHAVPGSIVMPHAPNAEKRPVISGFRHAIRPCRMNSSGKALLSVCQIWKASVTACYRKTEPPAEADGFYMFNAAFRDPPFFPRLL